METELKKENRKNVVLLMAASILASLFVQFGDELSLNFLDLLLAGSGGLILSAIFTLLADLLPQSLKHKIVYTRFVNELPGCRIDVLCKADLRIEYVELVRKWPEVFCEEIDGAVRNSRWYRQIYNLVQDADEVRQAHRSFLLYRETVSGLLILFLGTGIWNQLGSVEILGSVNSLVFLIQGSLIILTIIAARIAGNRFAVNAVTSAL